MRFRKHVLAVMALSLTIIASIASPPALAAPAGADQTTITVDTLDLSPFVITENNVKSGFSIDVLDEIATRRGWTITYGPDATVSEILSNVAEGRADAALGAIAITADRAGALDFSQPLYNGGLQILVPAGTASRSLPGLAEFLKVLFSQTMLVWLAAALAIALIPGHITWLLERRHSESMVSRAYFPGIVQAIGWSLGMLATQPDNSPKHWASRTLGLALAFVSIIFVSLFTATLTANLTVSKIGSQISSPSDLFGRSVCTMADTTAADYLTEIGVDFDAKASIDDCYAGLKARNFEAVVFDAPVLTYYVANGGAGTQVVGRVFEKEDYGAVFRSGSELRRQFDETMLGMREDGTFDLIKTKWFGDDGTRSVGSR
jgi:polar amino acid transport system substrate-binding protein